MTHSSTLLSFGHGYSAKALTPPLLDRGWRIDYLLANQAARDRVSGFEIDRAAGLAVSDHAPVTVELH